MNTSLMPVHEKPANNQLRKIVFLMFTAVLSLASIMIPNTAPAQAAEFSNGLWWGGWGAGNYRTASGDLVYCVEPGVGAPTAAQFSPRDVPTLPAYVGMSSDPSSGWIGTVKSDTASGQQMRQMNYVMSVYGQTSDDEQAAAVQLAVWMLRGDPGVADWLNYHLAYIIEHGGQRVVSEARTYVAEAKTKAVEPTVEIGELKLTSDGNSSGHIQVPDGVTELALSGAVFTNGAASMSFVEGAERTVAWTATLHQDGWQGTHRVTARATWQLEASGWPARLVLHPKTVVDQQHLGGAFAGPIVENRSGKVESEIELLLQFQPTLTTQVPERFVKPGEAFQDRVAFSAAADTGPWPSRVLSTGQREYLPITATGTLYGPFNQPQQQSRLVPTEAQIAVMATVDADTGPGTYSVATESVAAHAGYYYWVWNIQESEQSVPVKKSGLLPAQYHFVDDFGMEQEGHLVPMDLRWNTALIHHEISPDALEIQDRVTAELQNGNWIQGNGGTYVPATLRLSVYQSDNKPLRNPAVPVSAEKIATSFVTVSQDQLSVTSENIVLPTATTGWVTVQTCLLTEDQPVEHQEKFVEWCDDYGIPSETANIVQNSTLPQTGVANNANANGFVGMGFALLGLGVWMVLVRRSEANRSVR